MDSLLKKVPYGKFPFDRYGLVITVLLALAIFPTVYGVGVRSVFRGKAASTYTLAGTAGDLSGSDKQHKITYSWGVNGESYQWLFVRKDSTPTASQYDWYTEIKGISYITWTGASPGTTYKAVIINLYDAQISKIVTVTTDSSTPTTYCGDRSCNGGETCSSCPSDCSCPTTLPAPTNLTNLLLLADGTTVPLPASSADPFNVKLSWTGVSGAAGYKIQIKGGTYDSGVVDRSSLTYASIGPLLPDNTYTWWVWAYKASRVDSPNKASKSFMVPKPTTPTCTVPGAATLTGPNSGITLALPFNFTWTAPTNRGSGITAYWVQVSENSSFSSLQQSNAGTATSLSSTQFNLAAGKTYYWRVYAQVCTSPNTGTYSTSRYFTVSSTTTTTGSIHFRVREVNSSGQPTGTYIDGATAVLTKTDGTPVSPSVSTLSKDGGWVQFDKIPVTSTSAPTYYGILAYKDGYVGKSKQTAGATPNCTNTNFVVGATKSYNNYTAAWDNNVPVSAGSITYCHDLGLVKSSTPQTVCNENYFPQDKFNVCFYILNKTTKGPSTFLKSQDGITSIRNSWEGDIVPNQPDYVYGVWRGNIYFSEGDWRFKVDADDGVRLKVDGATLVDQWHDQVATFYSGQSLSAGYHRVQVEWYEWTGGARIVVSWEKGRLTLYDDLNGQVRGLPISADTANLGDFKVEDHAGNALNFNDQVSSLKFREAGACANLFKDTSYRGFTVSTATDQAKLVDAYFPDNALSSVQIRKISDDRTAPTVTITSPQVGEGVSGKIKVTGTVSDDTCLKEIRLYVKDTYGGESEKAWTAIFDQGSGGRKYSFDNVDVSNYQGPIFLTVKAWDYTSRAPAVSNSVQVNASSLPYGCPVSGSIVGWWSLGHRAIDIQGANLTPVKATMSGWATVWDDGSVYDYFGSRKLGVFVVISNEIGGIWYRTYYSHLSRPNQNWGINTKWVNWGDTIGYQDSTGDSSGTHLHYFIVTGGDWAAGGGYPVSEDSRPNPVDYGMDIVQTGGSYYCKGI